MTVLPGVMAGVVVGGVVRAGVVEGIECLLPLLFAVSKPDSPRLCWEEGGGLANVGGTAPPAAAAVVVVLVVLLRAAAPTTDAEDSGVTIGEGRLPGPAVVALPAPTTVLTREAGYGEYRWRYCGCCGCWGC